MKLKLYVTAMEANNSNDNWVWVAETFMSLRKAKSRYKDNIKVVKLFPRDYRNPLPPQEVEIEVPV